LNSNRLYSQIDVFFFHDLHTDEYRLTRDLKNNILLTSALLHSGFGQPLNLIHRVLLKLEDVLFIKSNAD
jgi:hypothetical protein